MPAEAAPSVAAALAGKERSKCPLEAALPHMDAKKAGWAAGC
ncbi:hypothetical protein [Paenibacillus beijingensis]|nr:hypothetical protein [Paenibacillus beijingensis]